MNNVLSEVMFISNDDTTNFTFYSRSLSDVIRALTIRVFESLGIANCDVENLISNRRFWTV